MFSKVVLEKKKTFNSRKSSIQDFGLPNSWFKDFGSVQDFGFPKWWIQDFDFAKS